MKWQQSLKMSMQLKQVLLPLQEKYKKNDFIKKSL